MRFDPVPLSNTSTGAFVDDCDPTVHGSPCGHGGFSRVLQQAAAQFVRARVQSAGVAREASGTSACLWRRPLAFTVLKVSPGCSLGPRP